MRLSKGGLIIGRDVVEISVGTLKELLREPDLGIEVQTYAYIVLRQEAGWEPQPFKVRIDVWGRNCIFRERGAKAPVFHRLIGPLEMKPPLIVSERALAR